MNESHTNGMCLAQMLGEFENVSELEYTNIQIIGGFSDAYYKEIDSAIRDLAFYSSGTDLYNCVQKSVEELLESFIVFAKRYMAEGVMTNDQMESAAFTFSRLTLNLLGMFKSFIDHGHSALSRRFGENSEQSNGWKTQLSAEYDASSAYRLFSNLRNYSQHVGMPPLHFSLAETEGDSGVRVMLNFYANELLETYGRWSKDARIDLETGPGTLHFLEQLQEWSISFHRLAAWIDEVRRQAVIQSALSIASIREKVNVGNEGRIVIMPIPVEPGANQSMRLTLRGIPEHRAKQILEGPKSFNVESLTNV